MIIAMPAPVADDKFLPCSKRLAKTVRRHLKRFGISPVKPLWALTWKWAKQISDSYYVQRWPTSREIASQYLCLLLGHMQSEKSIKMPYRSDLMPQAVEQILRAAADNGSKLIAARDPDNEIDGPLEAELAAETLAIEHQPAPAVVVDDLPLFADAR